jgi:hypothetical protein
MEPRLGRALHSSATGRRREHTIPEAPRLVKRTNTPTGLTLVVLIALYLGTQLGFGFLHLLILQLRY